MWKLASVLVLVCACGEVIGPVTVTISPAEPTSTDDLVAMVEDGDGRTLSYRWVNGTTEGPTGETLSADMTTKGDVWTVEVIDRNSIVGTASVRIGNAPATAMAPTFATPNFAAAPLTCLAGTAMDPDGDPLVVSVAWEKDGAPYTGTLTKTTLANDTIPRATTVTGEVYKCIVSANDGTGPTKVEATITVGPRLAYTIGEAGANPPSLQKIDLDTGEITEVGPLGVAYAFGDLAWDRVAQKLYMVDGRGANSLYTIDTATGAATLVGAHNITDMFALGWHPSGLYGIAGTTFYRVNAATGAATAIGTLPTSGFEGLVYDPTRFRMTAMTYSGAFYDVNVTNGSAFQFATGVSMNDMGATYDPYVDRYYAAEYSFRLFSFDPSANYAGTLKKDNLGSHSSLALPLPPP